MADAEAISNEVDGVLVAPALNTRATVVIGNVIAQARNVLTQVLVASIAFSTLRGIIGLVLGVGGTWLVTWRLDMPFVVSPAVMAVGFTFSVAIGVIFGYFPARKAAMLNPIDALRHE